MNGLTITLCVGKWAPPHVRKHSRSIGFCVGWLAFTVYFYDREVEMHNLLSRAGVLQVGKTNGDCWTRPYSRSRV